MLNEEGLAIEDGKTFVQIDFFVIYWNSNESQVQGYNNSSTEIVIILQFLGREIESSNSRISGPRNCRNAEVYFWA